MGGDGRGGFNGWSAYAAIAWFLMGVHASNVAAALNWFETIMPVSIIAHVVLGLVLFTRKPVVMVLTILVPEIAGTAWILVTNPVVAGFTAARLVFIAGIIACHAANSWIDGRGVAGHWQPVLLACQAAALAWLAPLVATGMPGQHAALAFGLTGLVAIPATVATLHVVFRVAFKERAYIYHPLLTHHIIEEADHAIPATIGNLTLFTCTRCTGMIAGVILSAYALHVLAIRIPPVVAFTMDIFVPLPIFIDWGTQRLGNRKSTTTSRLLTGALTGFGFYLITFTAPDYTLWMGIVLLVYFVIFFLIYFLSARRAERETGDPGDVDFDRDTF